MSPSCHFVFKPGKNEKLQETHVINWNDTSTQAEKWTWAYTEILFTKKQDGWKEKVVNFNA